MTDPLGDLIAAHVHSEVRRLVAEDDAPGTPDAPGTLNGPGAPGRPETPDVPDIDAP